MARMEIWMGRANTGKSLRVLEKIRASRKDAVHLRPKDGLYG